MHPHDAYVVRAVVPWDELDGRVVIALERRLGTVERALARLVRVPENVLVSLEGPAANAWRLADGSRRLRELPDEARPIAHELARRRFLRLVDAPTRATDPMRGLDESSGYGRHACRRCAVVQPLRARQGAWWICPRCRRINRVPHAR